MTLKQSANCHNTRVKYSLFLPQIHQEPTAGGNWTFGYKIKSKVGLVMVHTGGFSGIYTTPGTTDGHQIGEIKRLNKKSWEQH